MVKIYVNLIINDRRSLDKVPDRYRDAVAEMLKTMESK